MVKPTKPLYIPRQGCGKASVTRRETWGTFEEACSAPHSVKEPVTPITRDKLTDELVWPSLGQTGFSGTGFVFTHDDEYTGIDLDDAHGDVEVFKFQQDIVKTFNSYTELSPSGKGVHIIVKGKVPQGRRRNGIELYPHSRFFTMTGNVINNVPIVNCQPQLDKLFADMGGKPKEFAVVPDEVQTVDDEHILEIAGGAVNGPKFTALWLGNWHSMYSSQSEADFALIDIIVFYTKHIPQIKRLFRTSALGQRDKAKREDYVDFMIEKAFDRMLPPIDIEGLAFLKEQFVKAAAGATTATIPGGSSEVAPSSTAAATGRDDHPASPIALPEVAEVVNSFPPGLLGELAQYFYDIASRPAHELALAGAIGFMSGLVGRAYNTPTDAGLNQYILMLAATGVGKDIVSKGTSRLITALLPSCPTIHDLKGPGELVSSAGLIKWLDRKSCIFSIIGEFGKKLKEMSSPNAGPNLTGLSRVLLQLYSKSGEGEVFDPMAYSDIQKNTSTIKSPSLTIFGESVPETFYEALDEGMIGDGLLPRFMVFNYQGNRSYFNKNSANVQPDLAMISKISDLAAYCFSTMHKQAVHKVEMSSEADAAFDQFDRWTTDVINGASGEVIRQLWNRAHLKAIKLASLLAVCDNYLNPIITHRHFVWATDMIVYQTNSLIAKFDTGEVGVLGASGEIKQLGELIKVIRTFVMDFDSYRKYLGKIEMHNDGVLLESAICRKLGAMACFRTDRLGATFAIKRALKALIDDDAIAEIPKMQMKAKYNTGGKAYVVTNFERFKAS